LTTEPDEPTTQEKINDKPSIFWRIPNDKPRWKRDRQAVSMIEIEADGGIPREISLAADGSPLDITPPGGIRLLERLGDPVVPARVAAVR
jgi:hypothetical protein